MFKELERHPSRIGSLTKKIGTPQHFTWLNGIVRSVLILNLIDAILTMVWVSSGLAKEANPLLEDLVNDHPLLFVLVKLSLVSFGSLLLWMRRNRPLAVIAIFVAFLAYYWLLLLHLQVVNTKTLSSLWNLLWS